jgi:hypothetical protein
MAIVKSLFDLTPAEASLRATSSFAAQAFLALTPLSAPNAPSLGVPYQNGIIQKYTTGPNGPVNIPQSVGFQYSPLPNEINGIAGDYKVSAEASNVHGGTAHAYAFGDGGFSGYSSSRDANGILDPQQGYTYASATVGYGFQLVGPSSNAPVPVTFDAAAYVNTVGTGFGSVWLEIYSDPQAPLVDWQLVGGESAKTLSRRDPLSVAKHALCRLRGSHRLRPLDFCGRPIRSDPNERLRRRLCRPDLCAERAIREALPFRGAA